MAEYEAIHTGRHCSFGLHAQVDFRHQVPAQVFKAVDPQQVQYRGGSIFRAADRTCARLRPGVNRRLE
jgi:hypothetical protein